MTLFIPIYAIHRHEVHWERPDVFDPSRFIGESDSRIPRTAYMPFGAGPRICIGATFAMMEMTCALATMARKLTFTTTASTVCTPVHRITLRPQTALLLDVGAARV
jgi:cytochrome P450